MNSRLAISLAFIAGVLLVCAPVGAHHGNSAYDEEHPITINGTVVFSDGRVLRMEER